MGILDKAKELSNRVADKTIEFSSDEIIADTIMKAVNKQEKVNAILKSRGSNYRVSSIDLAMGIPPSVSFGIRRVSETADSKEIANNVSV
ncbi:hypothetical protein SAMN05216419_100946 [Nitrosomonas cryotolerans]|uniref:Uncharacterized protein n=1 Tax=Nitrosomonas cryotolerans ATCC 49181 TaxID=1131553 RepID=A0A1N6IBD9_9PROT|nr:hypothetical protein [Nitrosomonas cryotolerans]SFP61511.1 hypothetical protein SAMN05216419_100946 [Nitrosomonas cryotolerans]SIO29324.1 hypothetical protein SAMN02743940_1693 [Nitrosomonas cryotolerans ATCC 49181]